MTFTKNKIAAAMAGAFVAGVASQGAIAAVDVDDTANAGVQIASESVLTTASVIQAGAAENFAIAGTLTANNIPENTDVRVTVEIKGGATFAGGPTLLLTDAAGSTAASTATYVDSSGNSAPNPTFATFTGGGTTDNSVTFNLNTGSGEIVGAAHFLFQLNAAGLSTAGQQATLTTDIDIAIADNFGPTTLPGFADEPYISWSPIGTLSADSSGATGEEIDVAQDSAFFLVPNAGGTGDNVANVGGWLVADANGTAANPVTIAGATADLTSLSANAQGTIVATNGLDVFNQNTAASGVASSGAACPISTADTTTAVCVAYGVAAAGDGPGDNDVTLTIPAANTVTIAETDINATIAHTAASTAFSTSTVTGAVALASLGRNGSSARLNFALNPTSKFPMFIRVTNPSSVSGPVTLQLTNDDGVTSQAINISTITGGPSGDLVAGASTGLMSVANVFAAVQAADPTFDLGATNKLRVSVVAEFGGSAANQGVLLTAFTQDVNKESFMMMTDASN